MLKNNLIKAASVISAAGIMTACTAVKTETTLAVPEVTGDFTAEVLSVGKADAIILKSAEHSILIDCGEKSDADEVLEYLGENGINSVDYLFITHFDKDHVGGVSEVIKNISAGEIITPDYEGTNSEYESYIASADAQGIKTTRLTKNMSFVLDDVLYEVYPPLQSEYEEGDNDYSLVIKATHGDDTLLFTGDAENERIKELYDQLDLAADFLKMPHHGRIDDETADLVEAVSPEYAVITCGKKEGGDAEVLEILENAGVETYLTTGGAVTAVSSGNGITVTQTPDE